MIDRVRLTAAAKNQLITIKKRTGIVHYNSICRHAMCISLSASSDLVVERLSFSEGLEIDWSVLTGGNEELYINIIKASLGKEDVSEELLKDMATAHIHRGLSYIFSRPDNELFSSALLG
ncbi:DNA sulfur modification protein DndE [Pseudomonas aeruginosa]|uniref:DNA sulfur modification protein DndE n=1 Tax=Pseudomonas aeruginosa TaxID=287 RepID=UPI000267E737|nr:DNA sulfur modification protein DndE [Pseudomonas aeruginosa]AFM64480.1 DNA sulfur modification protein DndE [Pseudomonas aeruginosa DK2]EKF6772118.1 DNA sulfur modification protein DndE [Pseudomonas aeruginosa]MBY1006968.1 DNA sulfur modification protein DndE [Pseudomonas aeruginosa]MCO3202231.1 DNA sulfur modification protein DndE [Pseudomonas aeruginosa]MCP3845447.1 DNA sulfur modification protein DndE [Pseudomonas aeruginosa]